jgi:serine/threonine protein kinase
MHLLLGAEISQRIWRELKTGAKLRHENILPMYGYTYGFGKFAAIVSLWAEKGSLLAYLEVENATLTPVRRFEIVSLHSCQKDNIKLNVSLAKRYLCRPALLCVFCQYFGHGFVILFAVHANDVVHGDLTGVRSVFATHFT